jgi:hypothetical protein
MRFLITEEEKLRIKKLYESSQDNKIESLKQKINNLDLSDCDRVRDDFLLDSVIANKQNNEDLFLDKVASIKAHIQLGMWEDLYHDLFLLMSQLCLNIQIMRTIKEKKWKIGKEYFTKMYISSLGLEDPLNKEGVSKVILFLNTFREKYNQM